jgi:hypothetical protein
MKACADHEGMLAFTVLILLVLLGPLAYLFGADSRVDDVRR